MSQLSGSGFYIATDPDQEKNHIYKITKTANITTTLTQLNAARASRDWKVVKFYPCSDIKKLEEFVKGALKKKYIANTTEWVKLEDEVSVTKIINTLEALANIVNDAED
jgi:hypothetical protein